MKVTVQEITEITRKLDITLPAEDVAAELERVYAQIGKEAKLKGFRAGKVPRDVLEKYYKQDAESDTVRHLVSESYPKALDAAEVNPVSPPEISIRAFKPGEEFVYEAVVEVKPVITVEGYAGLSLKKKSTGATEKEVEEGLKSLQERSAQLVPLATERKSRAGDIVIFDYEGFREGKPIPGAKAAGHMAELGHGSLLPEFEQGLLEMLPGEKKQIDVTYPADIADKNIAGAKIMYEIALKELKEKKVPELNDEFAKDLGNFTTLAEIKDKIREQIAADKEQRERNALAKQVVEKLAAKNQFPVPEGMIQVELEAMLHNLQSQLRSQGMTLEQVGIKPEDFNQKNRDEAKLRVIGSLLFDAIAHKESIAVSSAEVEQKIEEMAKRAGQAPDAWKRYYQEKNLLSGVESSLREEKALDFVLGKAKIKGEE